MAGRKPLVLNSGAVQQLQSGDYLDAAVSEVNLITATNEESSDAITQGMAAYVSSTGKVKKAKNDAAATSKVIGLCYSASIASGNSGQFIVSGQLVMADWTSVVGAAALTPNAYYYLDGTAGLLTTTAPTSTGYVTCVGLAISTTEMDIQIEKPIQL